MVSYHLFYPSYYLTDFLDTYGYIFDTLDYCKYDLPVNYYQYYHSLTKMLLYVPHTQHAFGDDIFHDHLYLSSVSTPNTNHYLQRY